MELAQPELLRRFVVAVEGVFDVHLLLVRDRRAALDVTAVQRTRAAFLDRPFARLSAARPAPFADDKIESLQTFSGAFGVRGRRDCDAYDREHS
ncbi:MAG TPA: hypothetical protein VEK79_19160 [Thermoanaerobaculia bacterium]|nr:hypothetical protein [Thermoanaerobaculia bacterium]